jgi:hypothetical protein
MTTPFVTPVRVIAALYPSIPQAIDVYSRFREPKQVLPRKIRARDGSGRRGDDRGNGRGGSARASNHCTQWPRACGRGCLEQLS